MSRDLAIGSQNQIKPAFAIENAYSARAASHHASMKNGGDLNPVLRAAAGI